MSKPKPLLQRILVLVSAFAFLGSTGFVLIGMYRDGLQSTPTASSEVANASQQLQTQARGYEQVLAREPENPIALRGLVETRIAMADYQGAIAPMTKLVELYPEEQQYEMLLTALKEKAQTTDVPEGE